MSIHHVHLTCKYANVLQVDNAFDFNNAYAVFQYNAGDSCFMEMSQCPLMSFAFWLKLTGSCGSNDGIIGAKSYSGGQTEGMQVYGHSSSEIR